MHLGNESSEHNVIELELMAVPKMAVEDEARAGLV